MSAPDPSPQSLIGKGTGPRLAAVLGSPVAHSLSPLIHRTWAEREGAPGFYIPVEAGADFSSFSRACDALRALGFAGCNVTIPHKEHALRYADRRSPAAEAIGAANMLTFTDIAYADNSDAAGLAAALALPRGACRALVLGAGGAGRAASYALARIVGGAPGHSVNVVVCNRSRERALEVARPIGAEAWRWEERNAALASVDLLVNATSLGMTGKEPLDLDVARLPSHAIVCDIVYSPLETPLLLAARARGLRCVDGLEMLMRQAVPGYLAWLGTKAEVDEALRRTLTDALARRASNR